MSFIEQIEQANLSNSTAERWTGTFRQFLDLYESKQYQGLDWSAHQRIYNMIIDAGTEEKDHFGTKRISYKFFEDTLFGIEDAIDGIMSYLHSAAQRTETSRRMLLLVGPPSSGKSQIVTLIKRGLEAYSRNDRGAVFAISGSQMHENPFLLVPHDLRSQFEKNYGIKIEGELSPISQWRLQNEFNGKFLDFPVERIFISEASRIGIGTWLPSDVKSQDTSELVGGLDFANIAKYGQESDPRSYNFDGELNVANRGIMEFIEGIKADEKFLRVLLTATQEKSIKAPRFGLISVDAFIILHTNEEEFTSFMKEKKYEAYHDRMCIVKVPYNLGVSNEVKIYEKLLQNSDAISNMHIAPGALRAAAMFSVLSRLDPTDNENLTKRMKLYDKQNVKGYKTEQVPDLRKKSPREGLSGTSPRFIIDQICVAITRAKNEGKNFITAIDCLKQLNRGVFNRDTFAKEDKNRYDQYIDDSRTEWNDALRNDIQKAFFLSFEHEAKNMCENYLDQIYAMSSGTKAKDPVTGEDEEPDEKLMDEVESHLEISQSGKEDFRQEIIRLVGDASRKNKKFDYTQHAPLREAIQKSLFKERHGVIRMTVSTRNPDPDALRRLNEVIDRMVQDQGYSPESANELLRYATTHLFERGS